MESFEEKGYWWLSNYPNNRIPGTLKFSPEKGIELELIGTFDDRTPWVTNENGDQVKHYTFKTELHKFINGENFVGKNFSIYNAFQKSSSGSLFDAKARVSTYSGSYLFSGHHFNREEELSFDTFRLRYHYLPEWFAITGYEASVSSISRKKKLLDFEEYSLTYNNPEELIYKIKDINTKSKVKSFDFSIYHSFNNRFVNMNPILQQSTYIEIKLPKKMDFQNFRDEIELTIETFFMFLIKKTLLVLEMWVKNEDLKKSIEVFYENEKPHDYQENISRHNYFIKYQGIEDNFGTYLTNWFNKIYELKPVFDLYFNATFYPDMLIQNQFLNLSGALEVYHRRLLRKPELAPSELAKRQEKIIKAFPEYEEWLKSKLKHNEPSLKVKLEELVNIVKPIIGEYNKKIDDLPKQVADRRNYLTHYDKNDEKKFPDQNQFYREIDDLSAKIRMIMDVLFLKELGLEDDKIKTVIKEHLILYFVQYIG